MASTRQHASSHGKRRTPWLTVVGVVLLAAIVVAGAAAAGQRFGAGAEFGATAGTHTRSAHHEQMEAILEDGSYEDLAALREEIGLPLMPRVQSEEDFALMQERHEQMEELYGEGPHAGMGRLGGAGNRFGNAFGQGFGGCPMR